MSAVTKRLSHRPLRALLSLGVAVLLAGCSSTGASPSATQAAASQAAASQAAASQAAASQAAASQAAASQAAASPCDSSQAKTLVYMNAEAVVSRFVFDEKGFKDETAALCDNAVVIDAGGSADTQSNQIDSMITKHVDAIVMAPVNIATAGALYDRAKAAGLGTVDYNFVVPNITPDYIVDRNAIEFGEIAAKQALLAYPTGNYIIIGGDQTYSVALDETKGMMNVLQPEIDAGKVKIVSQQWNANWSPQTAQTQVEAALVKTNNAIQAVLSNNDGMAIGAMAALKAQGLLGKVFVSGVDCDLANVQAIAQGNQSVCIWTDFYQMGKFGAMAADAAARHISLSLPELQSRPNGNVSVPTIQMPTIVVDKTSLCLWLKQSQWVPFNDAYKGVSPVPTC